MKIWSKVKIKKNASKHSSFLQGYDLLVVAETDKTVTVITKDEFWKPLVILKKDIEKKETKCLVG